MKNFSLIFVILCVACLPPKESTENNPKQPEVIHVVNDDERPQLLKMSNLARGVEYIPLRFTNANRADTLIGNADLFFVVENGFILVDLRITKAIYSFDPNGELRFIVSALGKGPGEYLKIEDLFISDDFLTIYDSEQGKLIRYDFNGSFVSESRTPYNFYTFYEIEGKRIMYTKFLDNRGAIGEKANYRVLIAHTSDNSIDAKVFPFPEKLLFSQVTSLTQTFYPYGDSVTFIQPLDNTIYRVGSGGALVPRYNILFAKNPMPRNYLDDESIYDKNKDVREKGYPTLASSVMENDKLLMFRYVFGRFIYTAVYDKQLREAAAFMAIFNDFDNFFTSSLRFVEDDNLYAIFNPADSGMPDSFIPDSTSQRFINIFNKNGKKGGNPLIVKYFLK